MGIDAHSPDPANAVPWPAPPLFALEMHDGMRAELLYLAATTMYGHLGRLLNETPLPDTEPRRYWHDELFNAMHRMAVPAYSLWHFRYQSGNTYTVVNKCHGDSLNGGVFRFTEWRAYELAWRRAAFDPRRTWHTDADIREWEKTYANLPPYVSRETPASERLQGGSVPGG